MGLLGKKETVKDYRKVLRDVHAAHTEALDVIKRRRDSALSLAKGHALDAIVGLKAIPPETVLDILSYKNEAEALDYALEAFVYIWSQAGVYAEDLAEPPETPEQS